MKQLHDIPLILPQTYVVEKEQGGKHRPKMGQEQSSPMDDSTPPQTLKERSVDSVATYIKQGRAKKIVVMVSLLSQV